ncbi:MAG: YbaK/EbsC family protein [Actinobacteria bacterium]|nr:YbaK/EbsC family protein [Actinomycetota bacterium]
MSAWPEPVQRVADFLRGAGAEARLEEFPEGTPTAKDAARAIGCRLEQVVKSVVVDCDGESVLVLAPGDRRIDTAKVARILRCARARVAAPAQVAASTGFAPGAVAPFPLREVRSVLMERTLLSLELVWVGAGSPRHMAGLAPTELARLAKARPMDAVQHGAYHPRREEE